MPSIGEVLVPGKHNAALAPLEEYNDLFPTGPHYFGLTKDTQHQLDLKLSHLSSLKYIKR